VSEPVDLIVVGFGAAGACAAIEAAEAGASVLALDRFAGGGASAISGGVVYAGGGTAIQQAAGVDDRVAAMVAYLRLETDGVVADATLERFCEGSAASLEWLSAHGVPFAPSLCPDKTSYPSDRYFLYYSGNEAFPPYCDAAEPAPRGHRAVGNGLPGANFFGPLKAAAIAAGVRIWSDCRAESLIVEDGVVVGVRGRRILPGPAARLHRLLEAAALKINAFLPRLSRRLRRFGARWHQRHSVQFSLRGNAVALTSGGFIYNRARVAAEAPAYRRGMPLGTVGCDGSGIAMAEAIGAATAQMQRISAWRFINPPMAFAQGILVDQRGARFVNEALYGAAIGEAIVERAAGRAWLIIDQALARRAAAQVGRGKTHWFQTAPARLNLLFNRRRAAHIDQLAQRCGFDPEVLQNSLEAYHRDGVDPMGKSADFKAQIKSPPFAAIDCSIGSKIFPLPTLTLGGLRVDEATGAVLRPDATVIPGLYAAGRAAVGICSRRYVSGLSLADCVFSGRRVGAAVTK
jgi:3-oxo-5alpha-steroid 4-dehydrogenase